MRYSFFCTTVLILATLLPALAQRPSQMRDRDRTVYSPHSVSAQFGVGWFFLLRGGDNSLTLDNQEYSAEFYGTPAVSMAYDYQLTPLISLGGIVSRQAIRMDDITSVDGTGDIAGNLRLNRLLLGGRLLFHYGNPENGLDLYSGLRAGITYWGISGSADIGERNIDADRFGLGVGGITPQLTIVGFGLRQNLHSGLFLGGEVGIGSPHLIALQAGYSFGR